MAGTDVSFSTLQGIANTLSGSARDAQGTQLAKGALKADLATDTLSAAMSVLTDAFADLADASDGAANKVRNSHESYAQVDDENAKKVGPGN